jgi:uncharacterized membrane protein YjjP (DUF1212 family)
MTAVDPRRDTGWALILESTRLLLEYNVRAELLKRQVERVAAHLGIPLAAAVGYLEVTLIAPDDRDRHIRVPEYRINAALTVAVLRVLDDLCAERIRVDEALARLTQVEHTVRRYPRVVLIALFGLAASALARILGADTGAISVAGVSAAGGLFARQELAKRHVTLFALPFAAALIGAVLGAAVIRLGWTGTSALALVVPSLMLVPGAHLINGVDDLLGNHMQSGIGRLGLAAVVLMAAALGVLLGYWLVLGFITLAAASTPAPLTLATDVVLAGVAAGGFALSFNVPQRVVWVCLLSGMVGHGARYMALQGGLNVEVATLCGCLLVGVIGAIASDRLQLPFSAVAFAAAVPMMPGAFIYEGIANAVRLSVSGDPDPVLTATTVGLSLRAIFVVGCIVLGLVIGANATRLTLSRLGGLRQT